MSPGEETIRRRMMMMPNPSQQQQQNGSDLQFYSSWFCPFAQRTWIALEETGVDYTWNEVSQLEDSMK
jgi:glutathione S-transferase